MGRTGSGKTTLLMALFRMIGLAGGRILVDNVDIANMPLREVGSQGARAAQSSDLCCSLSFCTGAFCCCVSVMLAHSLCLHLVWCILR